MNIVINSIKFIVYLLIKFLLFLYESKNNRPNFLKLDRQVIELLPDFINNVILEEIEKTDNLSLMQSETGVSLKLTGEEKKKRVVAYIEDEILIKHKGNFVIDWMLGIQKEQRKHLLNAIVSWLYLKYLEEK